MPRSTLAALLLAALAGSARGEPSINGASILARPLGARPVAMADAFCAVDGGLDSLTYNAAGLATIRRPELRTDYAHGLFQDNFSFLGFAAPVKAVTLSAGAAYYDAGTISLNLSNGFTGAVKAEQDWVGLFGAAFALPRGFSVGGMAKYYHLTLAQQATASGGAFDAGAIWHSPLHGLNFAAAAQNLGPSVKFEQEGDPLPLTLRAGVAYLLELHRFTSLHESPVVFDRFLFTAESIMLRNDKPAVATGLEMRLPFGGDNYGALRFGYLFNRDIDSLSLGIGFKEGRFLLDYALGVKKAVGNDHHFSLGVRL